MLIAGTFFSIGVYYILYSSFEYSLEREISAAYEDNAGISYEPWHYRYVGKEAAAEINQKGIALEEYLGNL